MDLGADVVIDYGTEDYLETARDIDIIFDTDADENILDSFNVLRKGGKVISVAGARDNDENIKIADLVWMLPLSRHTIENISYI